MVCGAAFGFLAASLILSTWKKRRRLQQRTGSNVGLCAVVILSGWLKYGRIAAFLQQTVYRVRADGP
jgi:hypothetical protein